MIELATVAVVAVMSAMTGIAYRAVTSNRDRRDRAIDTTYERQLAAMLPGAYVKRSVDVYNSGVLPSGNIIPAPPRQLTVADVGYPVRSPNWDPTWTTTGSYRAITSYLDPHNPQVRAVAHYLNAEDSRLNTEAGHLYAWVPTEYALPLHAGESLPDNPGDRTVPGPLIFSLPQERTYQSCLL